MSKKFIEKAAIQALSEFLGFDEGKAYFYLLNKDEFNFGEEFSHSKKYRLLKSMFDTGAVGKFKARKQDSFSYDLLPPSFLHLNNTDEELIIFLEKIYLKNYAHLLEKEFTQIIVRNEKGVMIFLLKYYMKSNAKVFVDPIDLNSILGEKSSMIEISIDNRTERKFGVIDKQFVFEFSKVYNGATEDCVGYIAKKDLNKNFVQRDCVARIEKKFQSYILSKD